MKIQILVNILLLLIFIKSINGCSYKYNSVTNKSYNLNSLVLPANSSYATKTSGGNYPIDFNLCKAPINVCGGQAGCQGSNGHPLIDGFSNEVSNVLTNGLSLFYERGGQPPAVCLLNNGVALTTITITCDQSQDGFFITSCSEPSWCDYRITAVSKYVCKECIINDCSGSGNCNFNNGNCECNYLTNGLGCENKLLYIGSVDQNVTITGGRTVIRGFFGVGTTANSIEIKIGQSLCANITVISTDTLSCDIVAGTGAHDVTVTSLTTPETFTSKNAFIYNPLKFKCPSNCTSPTNGICDTTNGYCQCFDKFIGLDCSSIQDVDTPNTTTTVNSTSGQVEFLNEDSNYKINIYSIIELDFKGTPLNEYILQKTWNITENNSTNNNDGNKIIKYSQFINGPGATVEYVIEQIIGVKKQFSFADVDFTLDVGSIKMTIGIYNYTYQSNLNTVRLVLLSSMGKNGDIEQNECNTQKSDVNTDEFKDNIDQNFNYITISKDKKTLYGRFIKRVISDGNIGLLSTTINGDERKVTIGLNLPHFKKSCLVDPDFSVLVASDYVSSCDEENKRPPWFLPVVIGVPVVGLSLIVISSALIYRKHRVGIKILQHQLKELN